MSCIRVYEEEVVFRMPGEYVLTVDEIMIVSVDLVNHVH